MSDSGYTPTAAEVKSAWVGSKPNIGMRVVRDRHAAEFERFVAVIREDQAKKDAAIARAFFPDPHDEDEKCDDCLVIHGIALDILSQSFTGTESEQNG